jgi:hypothetical protein
LKFLERDILFLSKVRNIYNVFFSYLNMAELPPQTNPASGQQGMAQKAATPQQTTTTSPNSKSGPVTQPGQDQGDKKPKKWIWIVVGILVLVSIIAGSYFLFFR